MPAENKEDLKLCFYLSRFFPPIHRGPLHQQLLKYLKQENMQLGN